MKNYILPFQIDKSSVKGVLVKFSSAWASIKDRNNYPPEVSNILGQTLTLSALLGSQLKYEGKFTLQIQTQGIINLLVSELTTTGGVRCTARFNRSEWVKNKSYFENKPSIEEQTAILVGNGTLSFSVKQPYSKQDYQAVTEMLPQQGLEQTVINYFKQSEQIDTYLKIFQSSRSLAGVLLQRLPETWRDQLEEEEAREIWNNSKILLSTIKKSEILNKNMPGSELLYRLFHERGVIVYGAKPLRDECNCSQEKIISMLENFTAQQLQESVDTSSGYIEVECKFCLRKYNVLLSEVRKD